MGMNEPLVPERPASQRVLVVEDDPALGRLIQIVMGRYSDHVAVVRSGAEAIEALSANQFDAIASDISLPDMSGLEVIAKARELSPASGIVAVTGFVDVDVAVQSMKAGADDFLGKPFDADILWHIMQKAVDTRARRREAEQAELYRNLAYHDALTGCPNRRYLDEFIVEAVANAQVSSQPLTVAYLDIDNFKLLNDFVGHEEGDTILCGVASVLRNVVKEPATFGRFGGDEFVIVFPGVRPQAVRRTLDKVRADVSNIEVMNRSQVALPTRISCGMATFHGYETPRQLVGEAEDQMYLDKTVAPVVKTYQTSLSSPGLVKLSTLKALRNLVRAIDRRDSYTRYHSDHATQAALRFMNHLHLPQDQIAAVSIGGPIHDLGKIVVPDEILRKPGPLTASERRTMEEHPVIGAAMAAAVTDYETVVDLVRHHHERFDGNGYPGGLRGQEISYSTRIFSVADAFSAMTTDRPYRRTLTLDQAVAEIRAGAGTQFDPDIAPEFANLVEKHFSGKPKNEAAA